MSTILVLYQIITQLIHVYLWIIMAYCLMSMALSFGIMNLNNSQVAIACFNTLARLVEPALDPIRRVLPQTGMMDFSPLVLLLIIQWLIPIVLKQIFKMIFALYGA